MHYSPKEFNFEVARILDKDRIGNEGYGNVGPEESFWLVGVVHVRLL